MEIASGCLSVGCEVTLVARDRPLTKALGPYLSDVFLAAARGQGLRLAPSHAVELRSTGGLTAGGQTLVVLADGSTIAAELVVSAVGDAPNIEWLASSGLLANGRLEVDSRGRVRPDIIAAGDVAAFPTRRGLHRVPLWTSAIEQSKAAALALVRGDDAPQLDFQPYFWTEQFGLSLKASGFLPLAGAPEFLDGDPRHGPAIMRWSHRDGSGTAVAVNKRIPIPKLRRLSESAAALASPAA